MDCGESNIEQGQRGGMGGWTGGKGRQLTKSHCLTVLLNGNCTVPPLQLKIDINNTDRFGIRC